MPSASLPRSCKEGGHGGRDWGRGGGSFDLLPKERGGGAPFSLDKLFAYQLTLVKEKTIPSAICSQSGAGVGLGLPTAQAARPSFRIQDSCPLDYFGKRLNSEAPRPSRHFPSLRSCLHTQPEPASSFSGPGHLPVQPTINILLPTSAATSTGVRFLGMKARAMDGELNGGRALLSPVPSLLCGNHSLHPPASTGIPQGPTLSQGSPLLHSLLKDVPTPFVSDTLLGWVG